MCILFKANSTVGIFSKYVPYSRAYFYQHSLRKITIIAKADGEDNAFTEFQCQAKVCHQVPAICNKFQFKLAFSPQNVSTKGSRKKVGQSCLRNPSNSYGLNICKSKVKILYDILKNILCVFAYRGPIEIGLGVHSPGNFLYNPKAQ